MSIKNPDVTLNSVHRDDLDVFIKKIQARIDGFRQEVRKSAGRIVDTMILPMDDRFNGVAYVKSAEGLVEFSDGTYGNYYERNSVLARDSHLRRQLGERKRLFTSLAENLPGNKRILNIGAGGDIVPIQAYENAGHEVISTDFSQNVVDILKMRIASPGFACDLKDLASFVPENSIDVVIGNSVMGYLNVDKVRKVVADLDKVMKEGAIFTFDLTPHPSYFTLINQTGTQSTVNDSAPDPAVLISLIEKYGVNEGINLLAHYNFAKSYSVQGATMKVLRELFENLGWEVRYGLMRLGSGNKGRNLVHTLRVASSSGSDLLKTSQGETKFADFDNDYWDEVRRAEDVLKYSLFCIDRFWAQELSEVMGRKMSTWEVIDYIDRNLDPSAVRNENVDELLKTISVENVYSKLIEYVRDEKPFERLQKLSDLRYLEQVMHKQCYLREGHFATSSRDEITRQMSAKYLEFGEKPKSATAKRKEQAKKQRNASDRRKEKAKIEKNKQARRSRKRGK